MVIRHQDLNRVFRALADPTRRQILEHLARRERTVTDLCGRFAISQPAVTKHLQVLEQAGLVTRRRAGRLRYARARLRAFHAPVDWIRRYTRMWDERLDALEDLLADPVIRKELDHDVR